ncbi:hypothetical protein MIDIC_490043 [Alphaproteobacteria bacterium]
MGKSESYEKCISAKYFLAIAERNKNNLLFQYPLKKESNFSQYSYSIIAQDQVKFIS